MIRLYLAILLFLANKDKKNWKELPRCNLDFVDNYKIWRGYKLYIPFKGQDAAFIGENTHRHSFYKEEFIEVRFWGKLYFYINNRFICSAPNDYKIWSPLIDSLEDRKILTLRERFSREQNTTKEYTVKEPTEKETTIKRLSNLFKVNKQPV